MDYFFIHVYIYIYIFIYIYIKGEKACARTSLKFNENSAEWPAFYIRSKQFTEFREVSQSSLSDLIFSSFIDRRRKGAYFVMDKFPVTHSTLQLHLFQQIFLMKQQSSCVLQQNERVHSATMTMTFRMKRMKNEVRAQPASALTLAANSFDG